MLLPTDRARSKTSSVVPRVGRDLLVLCFSTSFLERTTLRKAAVGRSGAPRRSIWFRAKALCPLSMARKLECAVASVGSVHLPLRAHGWDLQRNTQRKI